MIHSFNNILFLIGVIFLLYHTPLILRYIYVKIFGKGESNRRSAPEVSAKMIELLRADMENKGKQGHYKIIDLGSAYGALSREMGRALPEANIVAIEYDKMAIKYCKWAQKKWGPQNIEFLSQNFFEYDLSDADAVVFYLPYHLMDHVGEKLMKDGREDIFIISHRFLLRGGWSEPCEVIDVQTNANKQGKLNLYRKTQN